MSTTGKQPKIMVHCAWSGARWPITLKDTGSSPPATTTLMDVISNVPDVLLQGVSLKGATLECCCGNNENSSEKKTSSSENIQVPDSLWKIVPLEQVLTSVNSKNNSVLITIRLAEAKVEEQPVENEQQKEPTPMDIEEEGNGDHKMETSTDDASKQRSSEEELPKNKHTNTKEGLQAALQVLLDSNFDQDTKECVKTLIKVLDNILSKPGNEKVRSIRLANPAFAQKVAQRRGGVEFLLACGFTAKAPEVPLLSKLPQPSAGAAGATTPDVIELKPQREDNKHLLYARRLLVTTAVKELGMDPNADLPKLKMPPVLTTASSTNVDRNHAQQQQQPRGGNRQFNPYQTHRYNTQAAAVGAPDPTAIIPDGEEPPVSKTEAQLRVLQSQQKKLERALHQQKPLDRGLVATRPGGPNEGAAISSISSRTNSATVVEDTKSDGSLLAARMKRLEEERRKREEGGFTTQAMRDLEKMKKAKVYSHVQLRIQFPDGSALSAKFLPKETVGNVMEVIHGSFQQSAAAAGRQVQFDLYVAPPRRKLDLSNSLEKEGLVPAAKIFVSWKVPPAKCVGAGDFLKPELFATSSLSSSSLEQQQQQQSFPSAKPLVAKKDSTIEDKKPDGDKKKAGQNSPAASAAESREEALMKRMLGGKKGVSSLLGGGRKKKKEGK